MDPKVVLSTRDRSHYGVPGAQNVPGLLHPPEIPGNIFGKSTIQPISPPLPNNCTAETKWETITMYEESGSYDAGQTVLEAPPLSPSLVVVDFGSS